MTKLGDEELFRTLVDIVQAARPSLDTGQGVKLLYSDIKSLSNRYWTVGLQPGGGQAEPDQWCREDGMHDYRDGYRVGATVRPRGLQLRTQLSAMIRWLGIDWRQTLSLNLVPFRSARWDDSSPEWRRAATDFAVRKFWPTLLNQRTPRLIIAFGSDCAEVLRQPSLLGHTAVETFPTGWGSVTADLSSRDGTALLRLPHLSTFKIFSRAECRPYLDAIRLRIGALDSSQHYAP